MASPQPVQPGAQGSVAIVGNHYQVRWELAVSPLSDTHQISFVFVHHIRRGALGVHFVRAML